MSHLAHFFCLFFIRLEKIDRTSFNWIDVHVFLASSGDNLSPEVASVMPSSSSERDASLPESSKFLAWATSPFTNSSSSLTYLSTCSLFKRNL
uniref:DNA-directed RNA polymerase I largest subunit, putative n=1 Tax=Arundo donax TaxID=35708 RepID=A0A0A9GZI1_ARUDO